MTGGWGPPLRIARRATRRSPGRTALVAALIGLPVLGATWLGVVYQSSSPSGEVLAAQRLGKADAELEVSPYRALEPLVDPPLLMSDHPPAPGAEKPVRDPATYDVLPALPPGSKVARVLQPVGVVEVRGPETKTSVEVIAGNGQDPLAEGTFRLDTGQLPGKTSEVAVSPALADFLALRDGDDLKPGAKLTTADGRQLDVVGVARIPPDPEGRIAFAAPGSTLIPADPTARVRYLVDLPSGVDPATLITPLTAQGMLLLPRAHVVDPPPSQYGGGGQDAGATAVMALVIGFGVLEIVLLAGTAFAVGARRQTRELGLVTAAGGTPRDIRRIVLMQGLFAGLIGSLGGVLLALGLAIAGKPLWERMTSTLFMQWQLPWVSIVVIAAIGLLAGLAAAVVPAVSAGRQTAVSALAGRFAVASGSTRLRRPALVLLGAGIASVLVGSALIASAFAAARETVPGVDQQVNPTVTPTGPIALVLLGIVLVIAGLVWMLPNLVAKVAGLGTMLPLSARLALRDAARHRHRTGPATAAIMMAVAATAAAAFAVSNSIAADAKTYVPVARDGDASVTFGAGGPENVQYSPGMVEKLAALLPVERTFELGRVSPTTERPLRDGYVPALVVKSPDADQAPPGSMRLYGYQLTVVEPAYIARFGDQGQQLAAAVSAGKIVVPEADNPGTVLLSKGSDPEASGGLSHPAVGVPAMPSVRLIEQAALISPEAARKLGVVRTDHVQFELSRDPTEQELGAVAKLLGSDELLEVEHGYQSPARQFFLGILIAATVVTLLGVAISVSLSAAEGRADLATLAAVGAPPRRRRNLAAAQAWVLGQLGCLLGVGVGALYGYTAHAAFGSPRFMVPWLEIAGIVLFVPLFAGSLAWLLTRSQLPMVTRVD